MKNLNRPRRKKDAPPLPEHRPSSETSFLELGGAVQLVCETLRAEAVGDIAGQTITPSWWYQWESSGLLGLFKDQELHTQIHEPIRGAHLQKATESAVDWRKTLDVYRSVIDKSLDDIFSRRASDELTASPCGDLRESFFTTTTETVDDPKPGYAVALSD